MTHNLPIRASPYEHQRAAANTALEMFISNKSHGYGLLFEMGCGKTITAIAVTGRLYQLGKVKRLLIVAPLSILGVWDEEFYKFADFDYTLAVLNGSGGKKADTLRNMTGSPLQVAVINYESAWRLEKEILAWNPDIIIADESHKIKTHNTNASKAMHRLGKNVKYRLLLTGTVITNKALDVFSQYKFLNPAIFGLSFYSFRNKYFDMCGYGNHTPILKRRMELELTERLHRIAYRATKEECLDLPEITDIIRFVELEKSAMKVYRELVKDSYTEICGQEVTATNILTRLLRLSQLTGGFLGGDEDPRPQAVSKAKLEALSDIVEQSQNEGQKLVIIARFIAEIDAIKKLLEKQNIGYSSISGETKDRTEQVRQFQENPDITVFIGQIATAGLGITLTAASTLVFYSLDYSMSKRWENNDLKAQALEVLFTDVLREQALKSGDGDYIKFATKMRGFSRVQGVLGIAKSHLEIDYEDLDANPCDLNTPAGIVDLKTGSLRPHDPNALCTKLTAVSPCAARSEIFDKFLHDITIGNEELAKYIQCVAGMSCLGKVYSEVLIIAHGGGHNGKSTLWNTLYEILGDYSGKIPAEALTTKAKNPKNDLAELFGKRLVIASETEEGNRLSTAMLKQIASTDPLSAEKKFRDPFVFTPTHSLILYTNYLPKIGSDDFGTWRRLVPVPFNARIEKPELDLAERLLNEAGGAILQWCIEGAMMFIENGYRLPESVAVNSAKEQYKAENDWLTQFLEECCEYGANKVEKASLLYERYANWCMSTGEYKRCNRDFSRALEARGVPKKRANRGNYWYGVAICDNPD